MTRAARRFWSFVAARQEAYWRRERSDGPPYSRDPIIARYHFCNVYREADRGTRWFQAHRSREGLFGVLQDSVIYRLVNRVSTFEDYGRIPRMQERGAWLTHLRDRMQRGDIVFTGRHYCRGLSDYALTLTELDARGARLVEDLAFSHDRAHACAVLCTVRGLGAFFSWQVLCDILESGCAPRPVRNDDWVMMGPGAVAGARVVDALSVPLLTARRLRDEQPALIPPPEAPGLMTLKNVEHALCEYARYVRAQDDERTHLEVKPWAK